MIKDKERIRVRFNVSECSERHFGRMFSAFQEKYPRLRQRGAQERNFSEVSIQRACVFAQKATSMPCLIQEPIMAI